MVINPSKRVSGKLKRVNHLSKDELEFDNFTLVKKCKAIAM